VRLNEFEMAKCKFVCQDVKQYLQKEQISDFDVVVLDPPAFIKERKKKREGMSGYRKINELALRVMPKQSILLTCSCSNHLSLEEFRYLLTEAASRANRSVRILETYTHGLDHPELLPFLETEYLKAFYLYVE
jgi:23S rRNA (cytosine1962-C5)-methyltransferase